MNKLHRVVVGAASAAMLLGTMGGASAANTSTTQQFETRAAFITQLAKLVGLTPVTPATPDFKDVLPSNPDYGYIEAAYKAGWVNGVGGGMFEPGNNPGETGGYLTRAAAAKVEVIAYGKGAEAQQMTGTSTSFKDNASIPAWATGYVAEAVKLGLFKGYPGGIFNATQDLTVSNEGYAVKQFQAAYSNSSAGMLSLSAASNDVGIGQQDQLTTDITDAAGNKTAVSNVTYSVDSSNAIVTNDGKFIGSTSGTYTVTATTADGKTATTQISVYGSPVSIKIIGSNTLVANDVATPAVKVEVLDANGNVVQGASDQITLTSNDTSAVSVSSGTVDATNGIAEFSLQSSVPGAQVTLTATDTTLQNNNVPTDQSQQKLTVTTQPQVATSIKVDAPSYLSANDSTHTATGHVWVLDQSGNPMLNSSIPVTLTVSGAGNLYTPYDETVSSETVVYPVNTNQKDAVGAAYTLQSIQGETGDVTVTATSGSLQSATGTTQAVIAGQAVGLSLIPVGGTTSVTQTGGAGASETLTYKVEAVDAHGYPTDMPSSSSVSLKVEQNGNSVSSSDISVSPSSGITADGNVTVTVFNVDSLAGTYTLQATDETGSLTSSPLATFTVQAGDASALALKGASYISESNPTETITAQIEDSAGNNVAQGGVPVTFTAITAPNNPGDVSNVTLSSTSAVTNDQGQATITATVPPYVGDSYEVQATVDSSITSSPATKIFTVESTVAQSLSVSLYDNTTSQTTNYVKAGDSVTLSVYADDQYGNHVLTGDEVNVAFSSASSVGSTVTGTTGTTNDWSSSSGSGDIYLTGTGGEGTLNFTATGTGANTITVTDKSAPGAPSTTAVLEVQAGPAVGWALFQGSNQVSAAVTGETGVTPSTMAVTKNTPVQLTLAPVDAYGNQAVITSTSATYETITGLPTVIPAAVGGSFRTSPNGGDIGSSFQVNLSGQPIYFVPSSTNAGMTFTAVDGTTN